LNYFLLLVFSCLFCFSQDANDNLKNKTFSAKVIGISDGDTMEILFRNKPIKIRLAHIDAPEKRGTQPFGDNSKKALSDLCFGKIVTVQSEKYDRYKRLIAVIVNDKNKNVNKEMLRLGMVWHYKKYSNNAEYAQLENLARKNRVGLWQDQNAIAPWLWRENKKNESKHYKSIAFRHR